MKKVSTLKAEKHLELTEFVTIGLTFSSEQFKIFKYWVHKLKTTAKIDLEYVFESHEEDDAANYFSVDIFNCYLLTPASLIELIDLLRALR